MWNFQIESLFRKPAFAYSSDIVVEIVQQPQDKSIEELIKERAKQQALENLKKAREKSDDKRNYNKNLIEKLIKQQEYSVKELCELTALSSSQVSRIVYCLETEGKAVHLVRKIGRSFTRFWKAP